MEQNQYKLELPGGSMEIFANYDSEAQTIAKAYLIRNNIKQKNLKLFRYPKEYVDKKTGGLIEIPFFY